MKQRFMFPGISSNRLQSGAAVPGWLWVLALVSVGAFVILVGYMENYQANKTASVSVNSSTQKPQAADETAIDKPVTNKPVTNKPRSTTFDFYNLLPELEKIIPDRANVEKIAPKSTANGPAQSQAKTSQTIPAETVTSTTTAVPKPHSNGRYYLQAGSFKDFKAADSRRASLALIGIESQIQNANIPGRGLWHRVRIGPFLTMPEMRQTRKRLKNNNIDSIMLTVKK